MANTGNCLAKVAITGQSQRRSKHQRAMRSKSNAKPGSMKSSKSAAESALHALCGERPTKPARPVADAVAVKREPEINDIGKRCGVGSPCSQFGEAYAADEAEAEPETKEE
ncbi:unnamed protein product [Zymoseptoria tritici ST99CH_1E4]|uniref:Uncharacterized protein n=1 Tax=Zymoseptoria tritici ST99CH_1E4 TaxID=1276532 RepID=A0A2H1H4W0_ZYMTR|nr:unnamed protein product [Zymoseptoria tritici ST99CH_1E4]